MPDQKCCWKSSKGECGTPDCAEHGHGCPDFPFTDIPCDQACDVAREAVMADKRKTGPQPPIMAAPCVCPLFVAGALAGGATQAMVYLCVKDRCQMWGTTFTTEGINVADCRLVDRSWVVNV